MANSNLAFNPITGGVEVQVDGTAVATFKTAGQATELTAGIKFPATQVASADANTLDDYEEGTWTPTAGGGITGSVASTSGRYTKVGRMVHISGVINATTTITVAANNYICRNLPFSSGGFFDSGIFTYSNTGGGFISVQGSDLVSCTTSTATGAIYFSTTIAV